MPATTNVTRTRLATMIMAAAFLTACGSGVDGTYSSKGGGMIAFEKLVLKSGEKVEITAMGTTRAGAYEVEGKKVKITVSGDTIVFTIDDKGCLDGGGQLGKYCKT